MYGGEDVNTIDDINILFEHNDVDIISVSEIKIPQLVMEKGIYHSTKPIKAISIIKDAIIDTNSRNEMGGFANICQEQDIPIKLRISITLVPIMTATGMLDYQVFQNSVTQLSGNVKHIWIRDVELGFVRRYAGCE